MIYLKKFYFPDMSKKRDKEFEYMMQVRRQCYNSIYPFKIASQRGLQSVEFEPITIFYGSNGSGKSTILNIITKALEVERDTPSNSSSFFDDYVLLCRYMLANDTVPLNSKIITSDDVFDYMLGVRKINEGIDKKREILFKEYRNMKKEHPTTKSYNNILEGDNFNKLKRVNRVSKRGTSSKYVKRYLGMNVVEQSNGESAFSYFTHQITENALYLLDEPENSLSPEKQIELVKFIEDSARFFKCQFIIATHSPFILALKEAKIYDLDAYPANVKKWSELSNVRVYYDFFMQHRMEFEKA